MTDSYRRLPTTAAIICLLLVPLAGCEGDRFEPTLPAGVVVTVSEPPAIAVSAMAGHSLHDLVVVGEYTVVASHGEDGWTSLGDDWLGYLNLRSVAMNAAGDLAIADNGGRIFSRQGGAWMELPDLAGAQIDDVAIDHDGSIWACGRNSAWLPLLARWDGAWHLHQPPEENTGLYQIAVAGPGDLVIDGSRGLVFRFRDGQWEQPGLFTEVHDLWSDGEGLVLAGWLHRVGILGADGFEPLDDRVFPDDLRCIAANDLGDVAVGWSPANVAVRHDGVWQDLPPIVTENGESPQPRGLLLFEDRTLVARTSWGMLWHFDGTAWTPIGAPAPGRRAIVFSRRHYYGNVTEWDVVGADGIVNEIDNEQPRYTHTNSLGERLDVVDRARLTNGEYLYITPGGHWMARIGNDRVGSDEPSPHAYRAVASGSGGEAIIVGDAGHVEWGYNGIQFTDGPGVTANLQDIWNCEADTCYWVVGDQGTIARRAADQTWTLHPGVTDADLAAVWARDGQDVYVVGSGGTVLAWNGAAWRDLHCPLDQDLTAVMGSDGNYLWVCGHAGALAMHDGDRWRVLDMGYASDLLDLALQSFRQAVVLADDGSLLGCTVLDP